jgi:hypothetical protein
MRALAFPLIAALAGAASAQDRSLAELAERQKKARTSGTAKVYTQEDLKKARAGARAEASPASETSPKQSSDSRTGTDAGEAPAKTPEQERAEKQADIQKRIAQYRDFIAETRRMMDDAQLQLNDVSSLTFGPRRARLQQILDEGAQHIGEAEQEIAALQEEARRAGIPVAR